MKKILFSASLLLTTVVVIVSCTKNKDVTPANEISQDVLQKISNLGFSSKDVIKTEDGFLVEGDINLTENDLKGHENPMLLRVGNEEQYRTTNLVTGLPRTITIRVSTSLPSRYFSSMDAAITRYNNQNLRIRFSRVTSGGNIVINPAPSGASYLASAGFHQVVILTTRCW